MSGRILSFEGTHHKLECRDQIVRSFRVVDSFKDHLEWHFVVDITFISRMML